MNFRKTKQTNKEINKQISKNKMSSNMERCVYLSVVIATIFIIQGNAYNGELCDFTKFQSPVSKNYFELNT